MSQLNEQRRVEEFKSILSVTTLKMVVPVYLLFSIVDYLFIPQYVFPFLCMRVCVAITALFIYQKSKFITTLKEAENLTILLAFASAFPITLMIWISGDIASPYYAGLNLTAVGGITFMPRTFKNLVSMVFIIYGPFLCSIPFYRYNPEAFGELVANIFFIVSTASVAFMVNYYNNLIRNKEAGILAELENKIAEIQTKQVQIDEKNQSLIKLGELAAQIAHDIRSPATALEAVSQMFSNDIDPNQKRLVKNAAKRINDIANNLVSNYRENLTQDLSALKIDRNIDLNSLIEDVIEEKKLSLETNRLIKLRAPESISVPGYLNIIEFQRVISNLINNALEALDKPQGVVEIELARFNKQVKVVICDNGKGIPEAQIDKIFEKGTTSKRQGAGLGLAHAKNYIESIKGDIKVSSVLSEQTKVTLLI